MSFYVIFLFKQEQIFWSEVDSGFLLTISKARLDETQLSAGGGWTVFGAL